MEKFLNQIETMNFITLAILPMITRNDQVCFPRFFFQNSYYKNHFFIENSRVFRIFKENNDIKSKHFYYQNERQQHLNSKIRNINKKFNEKKRPKWNGVVGDLVAGVADMSFAPLSISK